MIITEDGTGLPNSNAYADVSAFIAYCEARNLACATAGASLISAALIRATDYIDATYIFRSVRLGDDQALQNPRYGDEALAPALVTVTIELAIIALTHDLFAVPARGILSKEVAAGKVSSKTVYDPAQTGSDAFPAISRILRPLATRAGAGAQIGMMTR